MTKKMTKQTAEMVKAANTYLKNNHIKDTADATFNVVCWMLHEANCYHGFNYFKADVTLSGGNYDEYFDHIEFYIV